MKAYVVMLVPLFFLLSCNTAEPPSPGEVVMKLEALDASCTEAWLHITLREGVQPRTVTLRRDTLTVLTQTLVGSDTTIVDEGLLPNQLYNYTLTRPTQLYDDRSTVNIQTMDTTSHNFTFQIDTLGDGAGSVLYDVAIINDTLVYAVGEIYKRDSLGNWDPNAYNLVKWDGNTWELMRIPFIGPCSAVDYPPLKAIWAISANQILVTNGGAIATYNGTTTTLDCRMNSLLTGAINKMFATCAQDIYAVGNNGTIVHFGNGTWRRIESGTNIDVADIFGTQNPRTGEWEILAVAGNPYINPERRILKIVGSAVTALSDSGIHWALTGVWFSSGKRYWVVGDGIWFKRFSLDSPTWVDVSAWTTVLMTKVRGNAMNDLFIVGGFGEVLHFNGLSMHNLRNGTAFYGYYNSVAIRGDQMVAVGIASLGLANNRAVILRGCRVRQ